jgi:hypothetical protein
VDRLDLRAVARSLDARKEPPYLASLFPLQSAFVRTRAKRVAAVCGRRGGKSEGLDAWLLDGARKQPGERSLAITLSKGHARRTLWTTFQRIEQRHRIGLKFSESDGQLFVKTPNEHQIWLAGCDNQAEGEKFRGDRYYRICIDEAGSFGGWLEGLIEDVLEPALMDLDGDLALSGSPAVVPAGYFYEITTGDGRPQWETHHWTSLDNPYLRGARRWLDGLLHERGWTEDHPRFRREYLGQWVKDEDSRVYPLDGRNADMQIPPGRALTTIGIDVGFEDSTAWVVCQWVPGHPEVYVVECMQHRHLIPTSVAARTQGLLERYPGAAVVVDTGGIGKGYAEEMKQRHGIGCVPAAKQNKRAAIEMLRGDILSGVLRIDREKCRDLWDEAIRSQWSEDRSGIDDRCIDHLTDALLYAHRHSRSHYYPQETEPLPGSPAWAKREQDAAKEQALREVEARQRDAWASRVNCMGLR